MATVSYAKTLQQLLSQRQVFPVDWIDSICLSTDPGQYPLVNGYCPTIIPSNHNIFTRYYRNQQTQEPIIIFDEQELTSQQQQHIAKLVIYGKVSSTLVENQDIDTLRMLCLAEADLDLRIPDPWIALLLAAMNVNSSMIAMAIGLVSGRSQGFLSDVAVEGSINVSDEDQEAFIDLFIAMTTALYHWSQDRDVEETLNLLHENEEEIVNRTGQQYPATPLGYLNYGFYTPSVEDKTPNTTELIRASARVENLDTYSRFRWVYRDVEYYIDEIVQVTINDNNTTLYDGDNTAILDTIPIT